MSCDTLKGFTPGPWTVRETGIAIDIRAEAHCITVSGMSKGDIGESTADLKAARADAALIARAPDLLAENERLRALLQYAVDHVREWHNMGMPKKEAENMWEIYWNNAPEMQPLRLALRSQG